MDFPRFRLLGTRLRTALAKLGLTNALLLLLLALFGWHEWANRTPAGRYVRWGTSKDEIAVLDTGTGVVYLASPGSDGNPNYFTVNVPRLVRERSETTSQTKTTPRSIQTRRTYREWKEWWAWYPDWWPES